MGIRGLTTFISKNSRQYLKSYELHDTYLVIDGNNLASHLYKWHSKCYDCFGGDYDKYARKIKFFFELLKECNITPIVVLDGGYETNKLVTIFSRVKNRIKSAAILTSLTEGSVNVFPLFTRDLFVDILLRLNIKTVRCDFEADLETASIARTLNCPILSYDSDFYIFDVLYIPFSTMQLKCEKYKEKDGSSYNYICCQIYKVDYFLKSFGGLKKEVLPLLATVLGNDYIKIKVFKAFYKHIKLPKRKQGSSEQQRRIAAIIKWLRTETYETAVTKILSRLKKNKKKYIYEEIRKIANVYKCEGSKYLEILDINYEKCLHNTKSFVDIDVEEIENLEEEEVSDADEEESEASSDTGDVLTLPIEEKNDEYCLPDWFIDKYRRCNYPAWFMDIAIGNLYFLIPQLELYSNQFSHHVSLKIMYALHCMLNGQKKTFRYVAREEKHLKKFVINEKIDGLPDLNKIALLNNHESSRVLLDILELHDIKCENVPASWRLLFISIIYWINTTSPNTNQSHIYALCLGTLLVNIFDDKVGNWRSKARFYKKYLDTNVPIEKKQIEDTKEFKETLINVNTNDCILILRDIMHYFEMDEKMKKNHRIFDVHIIDVFAKFQSIIYYVKFLNILLNKPFEDVIISDFYNGTFIYNLCSNFLKRTDLNSYVSLFLKDSTSILSAFKTFMNVIKENVKCDMSQAKGNKKRRKKKNVTSTNPADVFPLEENDEISDDELFDVNNRFSILKLRQ